jgi:uncharacterized protein
MHDDLSPPPNFALMAAVFEATLAVLAVALGSLLEQPPLETFHASLQTLLWGSLATGPILVLLGLCLWLPFWPFAEVLRTVQNLLVPLFRQCTLAEMAVIAILAGLGEEMLFRGVLQPAMADWLHDLLRGVPAVVPAIDWLAAAAVAVVFGLVHAVNTGYALLATLIGFYLGWLWLVSGDLAVPIAAHALYDFLALVYLVKIRGQHLPSSPS